MSVPRFGRRAFATTLMSLCLAASAHTQQGMVREGSVRLTDTSGAIIVTANVAVQDATTRQRYPLSLNQRREYALPSLSPGTYTLTVEAPGFAKMQQVVDLQATTVFPLSIVLEVAGDQTAIAVTDRDLRDQTYEVDRNTSASRLDLPLLDVPQDVATVPRAVLQDQRAITLADAVRNVAGMAQDFGFNGSSEPLLILRGFQATSMTAAGTMSGMSAYYVNGTKFAGIPIEMANVQTVEVIKGPDSVLYGRGEPGGIVNVVPRPFEHQPSWALEQTGSDLSTARSLGELSGPLDRAGRWLGRGAGSWTQNRSDRAFVRDRLGSGFGGVQWSPRYSDQYSLTVQYTDQNYRNDYGVPANLGTRRPYDLPWDRQFNDSPELSYARPLSGVLSGRHAFSESWSMNGKAVWVVSKLRDADITPYRGDFTTGGDCLQEYGGLCRYYYYDRPDGQYRLHQENVDLHGDLGRANGVRNQVLIGGDFYDSEKKGTLYYAQLAPISLLNPVFTPQPALDKSAALADPNLDTNRWRSGYLEDNLSLGSKLHVVGAVRLDGTSAVYSAPGTAPNKDFSASPRIGFVYRFRPNASAYGQFQDALDANNGRDGNGALLQPERSRIYETGVKYQAPSGAWNATLAIYQLTKRNRADYSLYPIVRTVDQARSRGVETEFLGRVTSRLATIVSYGFTEAVVTVDPSFQGTFLADVPRHRGSVWARYAFSKNWSGGLGVFAQSFRQGDQGSTFLLPGYGRMDAMLSYGLLVHGIHTTLQANGENLLDKRYYSGSHQFSQDWIQPGATRTALLSIRFSH